MNWRSGWLRLAATVVAVAVGEVVPAEVEAQLVAAPVEAEEPTPVIVVMHSYHPGFTWTENITEGIRAGFEGHGEPVELRFEYLDARRLATEEYFDGVRDLGWVIHRGPQSVSRVA